MKITTFNDYMASLPIERQKRINDRAAKLIAEIEASDDTNKGWEL